ncbi:MAG: flagellar export chaperone FliS [Caldibacillus sp.]|mgnify:CR=1 FL=1
MSMANPYQAYRQNAVNTATPGELTLMLYDGCLKFIRLAREAINNNDIQAKNTNIQKAQNIITELMVTLDMKYEISKQMMPLYDFVRRKLIEANVKNSLQSLEEAETIVKEFRETWKEVIKITRQNQHGKGGKV